ncbi:hypothetical protein [Methylobacterium sp. E-066]|uniref:hypothetical protein n=1 Tax=Methylobacterium sp. E-066 TaxID=2836584 RepID=UPI001FBB54CD|nr:hypothetical protein [Methylobacterium sp. E-066]MCJ2140064.1 hypothetical protein [Methylobacterium sp. E-066]
MMPDAALLDLMHHLTWQPPAIVGAPPVAAGSSAFEQSYDAFIDQSERELTGWIERGHALRTLLWRAAHEEQPWFTFRDANMLVDLYEKNIRSELRDVEKINKQIHRARKGMSPADQIAYSKRQRRLTDIGQRFLANGKEFALFLRALRAELDPETRGGPTFDNADDLEAYLLGAVA